MRQYTGNRDGDARRARPGLLEFVKTIESITDNALWNNGTYVKRDMRGKPGTMSVHSTGRAVDLSYRKIGKKGRRNGRKIAEWLCEFLTQNADKLGIELVLDYWPEPHGRGWRCDRGEWQEYKTKTIGGAPKGDWLHVELSPKMADSQQLVREVFGELAEQGFPAMLIRPANRNRQQQNG